MRISQNLDLFFFVVFFFADSFLIFSHFFCFPFSPPFFSLYLLPLITFLSTGKVFASVLLKTWKWNIDQLGDLAYFTTNFAAKIGHVFLVQLCQNLVDIQNGHTYGWICPCCASCLSKQSGDVKNDDVLSGSMVPDFNVGKIQLLTEKSLTKLSKIVDHDKSYSFETDFG